MKMKFGAIVVAGSGKIGGHVASKNRSGAYLRTKVTPTNPNTSAQAGARALLSSLSTAWSGLTEAQRLGWNNAVKDYATTDVFGDIKNPSGINLFIKLNANLSNIGEAFINDAPAKVEVPYTGITSLVYDVSTPASSILTLTADLSGSCGYIMRATPKVSNGTTFVKNQFRVIQSGSLGGDVLSYASDYVAKFGALAAGDKFFLSFQTVALNGQKGTEVSTVCVAVA